MAQGDLSMFNSARVRIMKGEVDLSTDAIKCTLHTSYTLDVDGDDVWADVSATEYTTGSGYTAGGVALTTLAVTQDNANDRALFDSDPITWASLGPLTPAAPDYAIFWDDDHASDVLLFAMELGTTATNGGNYTLNPHADGWLTL